MIDFPTFLQGIILLLALLAGIGVFRYFRSPALTAKMSQENRALALLLGLSALAVIAIVLVVKIGGWKSAMAAAEKKQRLQQELNVNEYAYVKEQYQPLGESYRQLKANVEGIRKLEQRITRLQPMHPNHKPLLDMMQETFRTERKAQEQLYHNINLEIRNAIHQSKTQSPTFIETAFYEKAKLLHKHAVASEDNLKARFTGTATLLEDSLNQAKKNLKRNDKERLEGIPEQRFSAATTEKIYAFLQRENAELATEAAYIIDEIKTARQKKDHMKLLSEQDKELREPLEKTRQLWSNVQAEAELYWWDILYAAEAALIAREFNMPVRNPAYRSLFRTLKAKITEDLALIRKQMSAATQSYQEYKY